MTAGGVEPMAILFVRNRSQRGTPPNAWDTTLAPLGFEGGDVNLYRYVRNSPTNLTDPTGLAPSRPPQMPAPPPPKEGAPPARDPKDVIDLVRMFTSIDFKVRQQASEKLANLLGQPPNPDIVDILEFNKDVGKIRADDLEAERRVERILEKVPYRRGVIVGLVNKLANGDPCTKDTAERELASLLGMVNTPKVVAYVEKVLNQDPTIVKLRKDNADFDKKIKELIKFKGIRDDIPLPNDIG
jgi:hypothetical protein